MRSRIADETRQARLREEQRLTVEERVRLAKRLAEREIRAFADASGSSLAEARMRFRAFRSAGRRPSIADRP